MICRFRFSELNKFKVAELLNSNFTFEGDFMVREIHDTELDDFSFDSEDGDDFFNDEDFA